MVSILSKFRRKLFRETIQPIERYEPGKYRFIGTKYIGDDVSVSVVWKQIFELNKTGCVNGFYHTHPMFFENPSITDDKTMNSWCKALGKPLVLIIRSGKKLNGWLYFDNRRIPMHKIEKGVVK